MAVLVATLAGCLGSARTPSAGPSTPGATGTPVVTAPVDNDAPAVSQPYLRQLNADGASSIWVLGDVAAARAGDAIPDSGRTGRHADVVEGVMTSAPGPRLASRDTTAVLLDGRSRAVAASVPEISDRLAFTIDLWFLGGDCPRTWYTLAGTSRADARGRARSGFDLIYYPLPLTTACRLGAELWQNGRGRGGCDTQQAIAGGRWTHYAVTYGNRVLSCYIDGRLASRVRVIGEHGLPRLPFGLGGSGSGFGRSLVGSLAYVAVYPKVLTAAQIARHAAAGG